MLKKPEELQRLKLLLEKQGIMVMSLELALMREALEMNLVQLITTKLILMWKISILVWLKG